MRNLPVPTTNDKVKYRSFIRTKRQPVKGRLTRVRAKVRKRYDEYITKAHRLENIDQSRIFGVCDDALVKCYTDSNTKTMLSLREEILYPDLDNFDECPFCGINEPKTLDHYLPKELFPEFSIFSRNLIPICGVCNSDYKRSQWIENGKRLFLHSYYDYFPDDYCFNLNVQVGAKVFLEFEVNNIKSDKYFTNLFTNHFDKLALNKRFIRKAASEIIRKRSSFNRVFNKNNSALELSRTLQNEATNLEHEYSKNHWKPVLYRGLAKSNDFCNGGFLKQVVQ
ncbi:hypothetical protein VIBNISOn1_570007 [Vibrio nigripulchritudo SOn1]|uniref:HNH endonuclease n=1 Tax=Vibrio nigripulchritudo SOn1 TaxID=1238450 RepID=A0AAV2VVA3_9VIBR|nr:hypothetical protein [Vibrio nigripulchritudo]CCO48617.1 hypothetical protein VIBNISOn1_570007 [Vibrio nigripulchritudo SOn1]